jgi:hypothetical protein
MSEFRIVPNGRFTSIRATDAFIDGLEANEFESKTFEAEFVDAGDLQATTATISGDTTTGTLGVGSGTATNLFNVIGTWIPTIGDGTNVFTPAGTTLGSYVRFGSIVFITRCIMDWSSKGSASGTVRLSLPFTSLHESALSLSYVNSVTFGATEVVTLRTAPGQSYATVTKVVSAGAASNIAAADFTASGVISFSGFFRTADP